MRAGKKGRRNNGKGEEERVCDTLGDASASESQLQGQTLYSDVRVSEYSMSTLNMYLMTTYT